MFEPVVRVPNQLGPVFAASTPTRFVDPATDQSCTPHFMFAGTATSILPG